MTHLEKPPYLEPLYEEQLRMVGIPAPFTFGFMDRVRFREIDALGHTNNAAYMSWFETLRIMYLKDYSLADFSNPMRRDNLVLRQAQVDYLAPLYLDDDYIVAARSNTYRSSSWTMEYGVFARGQLCVKSTAVIVSLTEDAKGKKPLTEAQIEALVSRDRATLSA